MDKHCHGENMSKMIWFLQVATILGWHDVGKDWEVRPGLCPVSKNAKASNHCEVDSWMKVKMWWFAILSPSNWSILPLSVGRTLFSWRRLFELLPMDSPKHDSYNKLSDCISSGSAWYISLKFPKKTVCFAEQQEDRCFGARRDASKPQINQWNTYGHCDLCLGKLGKTNKSSSRVFQANEPKMERTMEPSHIQRTAMVTQAFGQAVSDYTPEESSKNAHISACEDSKSNWSQAILTYGSNCWRLELACTVSCDQLT